MFPDDAGKCNFRWLRNYLTRYGINGTAAYRRLTGRVDLNDTQCEAYEQLFTLTQLRLRAMIIDPLFRARSRSPGVGSHGVVVGETHVHADDAGSIPGQFRALPRRPAASSHAAKDKASAVRADEGSIPGLLTARPKRQVVSSHGAVVTVSGLHADDPGSIPSGGMFNEYLNATINIEKTINIITKIERHGVSLASVAAIAGYPYVTVPAGMSKGVPMSVTFVSKPEDFEAMMYVADMYQTKLCMIN